MAYSDVIPRGESTKDSWRRSPVEAYDDFLVDINVLNVNMNYDYFLFVYKSMIASKSLNSFHWDVHESGSLSFPEFLWMFSEKSGRFMLFLSYKDEFVGVATLNDIQSKHRCCIGIYIDPKWRGPRTENIGIQLITYIHATLGVRYAYALTPWNSAKQLCARVGMQSVAEIPSYAMGKGKEMDVEVFMTELGPWKNTLMSHLVRGGMSNENALMSVVDIFKEKGDA